MSETPPSWMNSFDYSLDLVILFPCLKFLLILNLFINFKHLFTIFWWLFQLMIFWNPRAGFDLFVVWPFGIVSKRRYVSQRMVDVLFVWLLIGLAPDFFLDYHEKVINSDGLWPKICQHQWWVSFIWWLGDCEMATVEPSMWLWQNCYRIIHGITKGLFLELPIGLLKNHSDHIIAFAISFSIALLSSFLDSCANLNCVACYWRSCGFNGAVQGHQCLRSVLTAQSHIQHGSY